MKKISAVLLLLLAFNGSLHAATDLNLANQAELEALSGIGPNKAKAIIEYRKKHGGFKSVDELTQVDGIGPATLKKLSKEISVSQKEKEVPSKGRIASSVNLD
jgi:competence protein ComEA